MDDLFDLGRFVDAQDGGGTYAAALSELRRGQKASHWMWFVFPQIAGLGCSAKAQAYAISSIEGARAYLSHPVLGPRLVECAEAVLAIEARTAKQIFGVVDALKLHSCMTLFARADPGQQVFGRVLTSFFGGAEDEATTVRL